MVMLFAASALVLASCGDDTEVTDVELTLVPAATSGVHFVEDVLSITLNAKGNSDNKLKSLTIVKSVTGSAPVTVYTNAKLSGTDFIYAYKDTFETTDTGKVTYSFTLTGEKGNASVKVYTATVVQENELEILTQPIQLSGQLNTTGNPLHFAQLTAPNQRFGLGVTKEEMTAKVDLGFFYGSTNKFSFSSPDNVVMQDLYSGLKTAGTFSTARATGFFKVPAGALSYDAIKTGKSDGPIINYATGKTYTNLVNNLLAGDIILFKTQDGKLGLIRITNLAPGSGQSANNAVIDFELMVQ